MRIDLTEEQVKTLTADEKRDIWNAKENEKFYFMDSEGNVLSSVWVGSATNENIKKVANCCADKEIMQQRAWHEELSRLLWRFSLQHGGDRIDQYNETEEKYKIVLDLPRDEIVPMLQLKFLESGCAYFVSKDVAQRAIDGIVKPFMADHPFYLW